MSERACNDDTYYYAKNVRTVRFRPVNDSLFPRCDLSACLTGCYNRPSRARNRHAMCTNIDYMYECSSAHFLRDKRSN